MNDAQKRALKKKLPIYNTVLIENPDQNDNEELIR